MSKALLPLVSLVMVSLAVTGLFIVSSSQDEELLSSADSERLSALQEQEAEPAESPEDVTEVTVEPVEATLNLAASVFEELDTTEPTENGIFLCDVAQLGLPTDVDWIDADGTVFFDRKPVVEGAESVDSAFERSRTASQVVVTGNGLPDHSVGQFDEEVTKYLLDYRLPRNPQLADEPSCLPTDTIGIALTGAVIHSAVSEADVDAVATELFDACQGSVDEDGFYHYHYYSDCFEQGADDKHSPQIGYALDGFGIFGPQDEDGTAITNMDLDECHGHVGPTPDNPEGVYHYHMNNEFPYSLGCFSGELSQ